MVFYVDDAISEFRNYHPLYGEFLDEKTMGGAAEIVDIFLQEALDNEIDRAFIKEALFRNYREIYCEVRLAEHPNLPVKEPEINDRQMRDFNDVVREDDTKAWQRCLACRRVIIFAREAGKAFVASNWNPTRKLADDDYAKSLADVLGSTIQKVISVVPQLALYPLWERPPGRDAGGHNAQTCPPRHYTAPVWGTRWPSGRRVVAARAPLPRPAEVWH